jgi:RNA polymerase sigma-70 factor, ECF subfamily
MSRQSWLEWIEGLERGDAEAIRSLTAIVTARLVRLRAFDLEEHWDDICQEVLEALLRKGRRIQLLNSEAFVGYLGTITRNTLIGWIRRRRAGRSRTVPLEDVDASAAEATPMPQDAELLLDLESALRELPEKHRIALDLIYVRGYTYQQAADRMELPLGTLKNLQSQGLRMLRASMKVCT